MALWFFAAIFGVIFSTFYFLYDADRLAGGQDPSVAAAEIFVACHNAALAEARSNIALGAGAAAARNCRGTGVNALTVPSAAGLNVTGIAITINPGADVGSATGRVVVTYLTNGTPLNSVSFETVRSQFGQRYTNDPSAGQVQLIGGFNVINTVPTVVARVPLIVPVGSLALVTSIQP